MLKIVAVHRRIAIPEEKIEKLSQVLDDAIRELGGVSEEVESEVEQEGSVAARSERRFSRSTQVDINSRRSRGMRKYWAERHAREARKQKTHA